MTKRRQEVGRGKQYVAGQAALASAVGLSDRQIRRHLASGAPGPDRHGRFDLGEWKRCLAARPNRVSTTDPDLREAMRRKILAEAELKEIEVGVRRGKYITVEVANAKLERLCGMFRAVLDRAGFEIAKLLAEVPPTEFRTKIEDIWGDRVRGELDSAVNELWTGGQHQP